MVAGGEPASQGGGGSCNGGSATTGFGNPRGGGSANSRGVIRRAYSEGKEYKRDYVMCVMKWRKRT